MKPALFVMSVVCCFVIVVSAAIFIRHREFCIDFGGLFIISLNVCLEVVMSR